MGGDVEQDHVGEEDPEGQGGQGQVQASQPEGGKGYQGADDRGGDHADEDAAEVIRWCEPAPVDSPGGTGTWC